MGLPSLEQLKFGLVLALALWLPAGGASGSYAEHPAAKELMREMVAEHGFEAQQLRSWFAQAEKKQAIIDAMSRPAEKTKTWGQYRSIFLTPTRIEKGVEFWQSRRQALARVAQQTGVPAEIIVAIIGVETLYGQYRGNYRVMDALTTLAFDYPSRSAFFSKELKQFLLLAREQGRDPLSLQGSYAGAMGYGQFMPSSYRAYAVDYDGDGLVDIWSNEEDAIASVANYFVRHGWRSGEAVAVPATVSGAHNRDIFVPELRPRHTVAQLREQGFNANLALAADMPARAMQLQGDGGTEYWLGLHNFYVITRYNHSELYALAVYELSQAIRERAESATVGAK
ncbi:lytic murein transglycosylase B [Pseudomaricurvus alcaniphilus]|nr:lytic murein transglycosylase B [Pseudomaricurvus alcaniphilus]NHN39701.1 lytic murein transglycosylase B [Pseudomaricurvus alcaniphilus]